VSEPHHADEQFTGVEFCGGVQAEPVQQLLVLLMICGSLAGRWPTPGLSAATRL
jgi:hypothetical protein